MIALENIVLGLQSKASDAQLEQVAVMANLIKPRTGTMQLSLTTHAAIQMNQLVERANIFRS